MDVVTCEAPLDNSFQKDRRELVNKGSLGRRRKPSRSNLRLILSPANDQQDIDVFHAHQSFDSDGSFVQLKVSTPNHAKDSVLDDLQASVTSQSVSSKKQHRVNRFESSVERSNYGEVVASINQICSLKSVDLNGNDHMPALKSNNRRNTEELVRSKHPVISERNNVNAKYNSQLFVAKNLNTGNHRPTTNGHLDVKSNGYHKTDVSKTPRIAESTNNHQVLKISNQQKTLASRNHINVITFSNHRQIITSSPVQPKKSALPNGKHYTSGSYKDVSPDETMLYRVQDERPRRVQHSSAPANGAVTVNGNAPVQEPEWISLSRKLCAKFVEGHIEPHSPDSYPYEEPEGVGEVPTPSPQPKTRSGVTLETQTAVPKKKLVPAALCDESPSDSEPPWIHLSRKLCNKFIEEHIEYPPITNGHFVEVPDLVEPNGDVRIIEKIGKPKGQKSKQKKESEPEWVSLSKKLRAKFIESHIDDPDTIALDNQLNASDPEETSSESLSDVSQDLAVPNDKNVPREPVECKNFTVRSKVIDHESTFEGSGCQPAQDGSSPFPSKECSWEYQEMEFDQESNSGNFQEPEYCDEPLQEARAQRCSLPEDDQDQFAGRMTFPNSEIARSFQNPECYNNDVKFLPYFGEDETGPETQQHSKLITVQFIARTGSDRRNETEAENESPSCDENTKSGSFFNLSTWEEAHYEEDVDDQPNSREINLNENFFSKSVDNLCDSLEERSLIKEGSFEKKEERNSRIVAEDFASEDQIKNSMDRKANDIFLHEFKLDPESSSDVSSMKENANCASEDFINETENVMICSSGFTRQESKENIYRNAEDFESSSEDEVFESVTKNKKIPKVSDAQYGKISPRKSPVFEKERHPDQVKVGSEKVKYDHCSKNGKDIKCNGMIPNSIYNGFPDNRSSSKHNQTANKAQNVTKEPVKLGMSKWITMSKSEQNISKPEYSNLKSTAQKESKSAPKSSKIESGSKGKSKMNYNDSKVNSENKTSSNKNISPKNTSTKFKDCNAADFNRMDENSNRFNGFSKECDLKSKCKSLCDVSQSNDSLPNDNGFKHHESVADLCSSRRTPCQVEFQHFEFESEIPLCAKLVSNHDKKMMSKNAVSPANRAESPSPSESSHVYEDMFKETPSGPSDSEASSWVMRNNTYYINGRSSSMNDLDFSDSGSLSIKCDYASSSENSTLQSRHSSYASSSFYVNLRDYDSHMMEPSLNKGKKTNVMSANSATSPNISKSNPPTPESLRHLFTSPLSSIHSPPNRTPRLLSRIPSDPQSHYYSTAAATSSAFKHGFALNSPKPKKKTERSSSIKIKDIAHGIILTFKRFQNHSKSSSVRSTQQVDVSHLAEINSNSELGKASKGQKNSKKQDHDKDYWQENGRADTDSGFLSDAQRAKARRSSSDLTGMKSNSELYNSDKKKSKNSKKNSSKGKKSRSKASEPRTVPTVSRKVQQMADGTLYLVTTVSGDTALPGVYSDSPDTSSELSSHKPVKAAGESSC